MHVVEDARPSPDRLRREQFGERVRRLRKAILSETMTLLSRPFSGTRWRRDALAAGLLFLVAFGIFAATAPEGLELRDEGHLLEASRRLADGDIPHRDSVNVYGPGVFAVTAVALRVGDDRIIVVRRMLAAVRAGAVAVVYLLSRHFVPVPFALLTAAVSMAYWGRMSWNLNVPYAALYTIPICLVSCLLLLEALRRDSRRWFFYTGLVAGSAVLFKQSLGIMNIYNLGVALWAARVLADSRVDVSRSVLWLTTVGAAALAAAAGMLPFLRFLHGQDYVLHFAPLHLLLALVAVSALMRGEAPDLRNLVVRSGLPMAAGVLVVLVPFVGVYAYWGVLGQLFADMIVLPTQMQNYYAAVIPPPRALTYTVLSVLAACSAGMLALARRPIAACAAAAGAAVLLLAARFKFGPAGLEAWTPQFWLQSLDSFGSVQLFVTSSVCLLASVPFFFSRPASNQARTGVAMLAALMVLQQVFVFQIFPRDAFGMFLIQGAISPLLGYGLWRWHHAILGATPSVARRAAGFVLVLLVPAWMVAKFAATTFSAALPTPARQPIELAVTEGIGFRAADPQSRRVQAFVELVQYIQRTTTPDTRLLLMTNEEMILFASDRRHALPDSQFYYFLAGWGMLRDDAGRPMALGSAAERLEHESHEVVVIDPADKASANIRTYDPELAAYVDSHFEVTDVVGGYRILKRKPASPGLSSPFPS